MESTTTTTCRLEKGGHCALDIEAWSVTFCASSALLAVAGSKRQELGTVALYSLNNNGEENKIAELKAAHSGSFVSQVVSSVDGTWLLTAAFGEKSVTVWDVEHRTPVQMLDLAAAVDAACFSRDRRMLATAAASSIAVWETDRWSALLVLDTSTWFGALSSCCRCCCLEFSANGSKLLAACAGGGCVALRLATVCEILYVRTMPAQYWITACWSPDDRLILLADHQHLRAFDGETGAKMIGSKELEAHSHSKCIGSVIFTRDPSFFLSTSTNEMKLWRYSAKTGEVLLVEQQRIDGNKAAVSPVDGTIVTYGSQSMERWQLRNFSLDSSYVEAARSALFIWRSLHHGVEHSLGKTIDDVVSTLFSSVQKRPPFHPTVARQTADVINAAFSVDPARRPDAKSMFAAALYAEDAAAANALAPRLEKICDFNFGRQVSCCAVHPLRSSIVAVGGVKSALALYDTSTSPPKKLVSSEPTATTMTHQQQQQQRCELLVGHNERELWSLAFSSDGKWLASTAEGDLDAVVWDWASATQIARLRHSAPMRTSTFAPDNSFFAVGAGSCVVLWSTGATWAQLRIIAPPPNVFDDDVLSQLTFSKSGARLLCSYYKGGCAAIDVDSRCHRATHCLSRFPSAGTQSARHARCWTPDEQRVMIVDGRRIKMFAAPKENNNSKQEDADDDEKGEEMVMQQQQHHQIGTLCEIGTPLEGHGDFVFSVAFTSDPRFFLSSTYDELWMWNAETMQKVQEHPLMKGNKVATNGDMVYSFIRNDEDGRVECFLINKFPLDPAFRDSVTAVLPLWSTLHPGVDHELGITRDEIMHNAFYRGQRPPINSNLPAQVAATLLSAFDRDPSKRPSSEALTELTWRALRLATDAARKAHLKDWDAGVEKPIAAASAVVPIERGEDVVDEDDDDDDDKDNESDRDSDNDQESTAAAMPQQDSGSFQRALLAAAGSQPSTTGDAVHAVKIVDVLGEDSNLNEEDLAARDEDWEQMAVAEEAGFAALLGSEMREFGIDGVAPPAIAAVPPQRRAAAVSFSPAVSSSLFTRRPAPAANASRGKQQQQQQQQRPIRIANWPSDADARRVRQLEEELQDVRHEIAMLRQLYAGQQRGVGLQDRSDNNNDDD